ncbi:hypothetical protein QTI91_13640 [Clostridium perfringens]|nr:hypothetical protein [Clostridium perfringens]MDM0746457.1 hypothetical protein [Clostridium perfringens]MDM0973249.1 hypothetical protein [Clostridium perfringens]
MLNLLTDEVLELYWEGQSLKDALKTVKTKYKNFLWGEDDE